MSDAERPSKSQLKREALAKRDLGARLLALPANVLPTMPLSDRVREAVDEARAMRSHGARKRQLGFIARLLRGEDTEAIETALEDFHDAGRREAAAHHRAEHWRDALLERGDEALSALMDQRHDIDAPRLRQLLRNAAREARRSQPPAAARQVFRVLREADARDPLPPVPG